MNTTSDSKRTIWVWAIAVFYFCTGAITLLSFVHILTAQVHIPAAELEAIRRQLKIWTLFGLLPAANIAAAISIFRMRRIAFHLFSAIFIARLAVAAVELAFHDLASRVTPGPGLTGAIVGFGINLAVCIYAWRLREAGQLT